MNAHHSEGYMAKIRRGLGLDLLPAPARKLFVALVGGTILLVGIVMIVMPGPALIVIPLGLVILGSEFLWAKALSEELMKKLQGLRERWKHRGDGRKELRHG